MANIQEFFTSRNNGIASADYVGQNGRLWFDPVTATIRVFNGMPGGSPIAAGSGTSNIEVLNQNIPVTPTVTSFNFIGSGVVATSEGTAVTINVPGAGYISLDGGSPSNFYTDGPSLDCGGVY